MTTIHQNITQIVGNTPLVSLNNYTKKHNLHATILAKIEYLNPTGSIKDRAALAMIRDGEARGLLKKGTVIIEPTSGNTGIGLAAFSASLGYRLILTMPDTMSIERRTMLSAYGAELVLTAGALGMDGAVKKAEELAQEMEASYIPSQFTNPANSHAHYCTTGPEIWSATDGKIDVFIAGVGTGGTITGTAQYLKEQNPTVHVVAVEPASSPLLSKGTFGPHKIQGIGANFIPAVLNRDIVDEILPISNEDAIRTTQEIVRTEGLFVGISSGATLYAANQIASRPEFSGKNIVVILPDSGDRYLSADIF